jgi:hypothetical protein
MQKVMKRKWLELFFLNYRIFVKRNPSIESCPHCKSVASLERLMEPSRFHRAPRFIGLKKYHCRVCKWEGYIYLYRLTKNLKNILLNYLIALFFLFMLFQTLLYYFDDISTTIIKLFYH